MKKCFLLPAVLLIVLLSSCATRSSLPAADDNEKERNAVVTLVSDIASECRNVVRISDLEAVLPYSYRIYSDYIPSYDELSLNYLSAVQQIVNDGIFSIFTSVICDAGIEEGNDWALYLSGEMVTPALKEKTEAELRDAFTDYISSMSEELQAAFSSSRETLRRVRKAYSALSSVGKAVYLPESHPISVQDMVSVAIARYFTVLSEEETRLRSSLLYAGGILFMEK